MDKQIYKLQQYKPLLYCLSKPDSKKLEVTQLITGIHFKVYCCFQTETVTNSVMKRN